MKKTLLLLCLSTSLWACNSQTKPNVESTQNLAMAAEKPADSKFHSFQVRDINGDSFDFASLKGKRVLVVNTASKCGYTPQYEGLQELYKNYGGDQFVIIGFPCNQFMGQEPGSNEEIKDFCQKNYGVSFPMMDKIDVKGDDIHPVYAWLTNEKLNGVDDARVSWNFNKFLIDENGNWVAHYGSRTKPMDDEIVAFAQGK